VTRSSHLSLVPPPFRRVHAANMGPSVASAPQDHWENEARRRFRAARHRLGISQIAAAQLLGVSAASVENWERGCSRIPAKALCQIEGMAA